MKMEQLYELVVRLQSSEGEELFKTCEMAGENFGALLANVFGFDMKFEENANMLF